VVQLTVDIVNGPNEEAGSYTRQCVVLFRSHLQRRATTPFLFSTIPTQKTGDTQKLRNFDEASESVTLR